VYDRIPRQNIKTFLGDFNAKIGREAIYIDQRLARKVFMKLVMTTEHD